MTPQEILEASQLIALMRADLSLIASTVEDMDRLRSLVLHKVNRMLLSFSQLQRQHSLVSGPDSDSCCYPLMILLAVAEMAERKSDWKGNLVDAVAKQVPLMEANLDKIEQALKEKDNGPSETEIRGQIC